MICSIPVDGSVVPDGSVFVVDYLDHVLLEFAAMGAIVLMLDSSHPTKKTSIDLPTDPAVFKPAWWLGSASDNNMGTVVYNASDPILRGMAPDGWADEGWYNLIQGGQNFILDSIYGDVEILMR